jgi:hypothetical protein
MAAYPTTNVGQESTALPDAGVSAEMGDDSTLLTRRDQSTVLYRVRLVHEALTRAEFDDLEDFIMNFGFGPHTFTFRGVNYSGTLLNVPEELDQNGLLYRVVAVFSAVKT